MLFAQSLLGRKVQYLGGEYCSTKIVGEVVAVVPHYGPAAEMKINLLVSPPGGYMVAKDATDCELIEEKPHVVITHGRCGMPHHAHDCTCAEPEVSTAYDIFNQFRHEARELISDIRGR